MNLIDGLRVTGSLRRPKRRRHDWRWLRHNLPLLPIALGMGLVAGTALAMVLGDG